MVKPTEEVPAAVIWLIEEMYKRWLQDPERKGSQKQEETEEEKAARAA